MTPWIAVAVLVGVAIARTAIDYAARRRHWRVGRSGILLCTFRRHREGCLRCETDYRYVWAHPTPYAGHDRHDARVVLPLCARCWQEVSLAERLHFYGRMLNRWRADGSIPEEEWDETRTAVYAAVKAGL